MVGVSRGCGEKCKAQTSRGWAGSWQPRMCWPGRKRKLQGEVMRQGRASMWRVPFPLRMSQRSWSGQRVSQVQPGAQR